MQNTYRKTIYACFIGYIVQAIVNNFIPLLFITFQNTYQIPLSQITMLISLNFIVQLIVDLLSASFIDKIGYRASIIAAHVFSGAGLILLTVLPEWMNPFQGILAAVCVYAVGGGLIEVLVSPIVEATPSDNKEKAMSLLHSFYCWGSVGVVLISTLFFHLFGTSNWKILALLWALIPAANILLLAKSPIATLTSEEEGGMTAKELFSQKIFWPILLMMLCAGASEQSVSQWASTFAEKGLGVSKAIGDLAGPMSFSILMGLSRTFYGKWGEKINLDKFMRFSCILCVFSYLCISLIPVPAVSLIGCAICGLSVGIMWPGTFSKAAAGIKRGGTLMFALMALAGDLGCSAGPTLAGAVSTAFHDNLRVGILAAVIFPLLLLAGLFLYKILSNSQKIAF